MIRRYTPSDAEHLVALFTQTVRIVSSSYYSPEEVEAWISMRRGMEEWQAFFAERHTLVDDREGTAVGFGCLSSDGSYIDMLFTHHAHQNKGTGSALLAALEKEALKRGRHEVLLIASATAWHFYQQRGYQYFASKKQRYGSLLFDCQILRKALPVFPAMRRNDRIWNDREARQLLQSGEYGFLAMCAVNGYGYGIPLNYVLDGESIRLHCAGEGFKLENIRQNNRVSFCVTNAVQVAPEQFTTRYESVLVFGRIVENLSDAERTRTLELLIDKYCPRQQHVAEMHIRKSFHRTCILRMDIEHWSGKKENRNKIPSLEERMEGWKVGQ
ncbi:MAG: GNAT family N-acetyltransferase [Bacteroidales bacterium]|jgi:nitroimidazol reductase NimA-like FMN-containing flavoprotein (pyridoxamine 5'-phosphate oxidase superfamily)/GNAT superfamily N-acetyltransferase|nr:GNAT family N-acetyltransferase [Bacteroidales bacterium]